MKTNTTLPLLGQNQSCTAGGFTNRISLNQLVTQLVNIALPIARQKNTNVVNEIGYGIMLCTDMSEVVNIIEELLTEFVTNSKNGKIHISADRFSDVVILEIQERNNYNGYALSGRIGSIGPEASVLGGHISMTEPQKKVTTVTFSFPDHLQVA